MALTCWMYPAKPVIGASGAWPGVGVNAASEPAILFAAAFERNQTPMSSDANFTGATFVTYESPTGERQSSPKVWKAYAAVEPERADEDAGVGASAAEHHEDEADAEQREADHHLHGRARLLAALDEEEPERGEDGAEDQDARRIHRLQPRRRNVEAAHVESRVVRGEEVHRAARLLVARPEGGGEEDDDEDREHALPLLAVGAEDGDGERGADEDAERESERR